MKLYLIFPLFFIPIFNSFCNGKIATTEVLTLGNQLYVKISVGNPGVDYNLRLQFASSILWFKPKRHNQRSPSSKRGNSVNKEGGTSVSDTIKIGDVSFPNVPLIEAKSGIPKMDKSFSGSFGLSPENNEHLTSILSQLDKQIVTMKIAGGISGGGGIISAGIGSLTLGGEDSDCKNYKYVKASCGWSAGLQSVKIGTSNIIVGSLDNLPKIKMSDSLPNMYGPKGQIDALANGLGVPIPSNPKHRYVFPCKKNMPDITLTVGMIGGDTANVILKPDQYIEKTFNDTGEQVKTTCQLYFMPNEALSKSNNKDWTMGQAFMFNRCISVNLKDETIGFADKN